MRATRPAIAPAAPPRARCTHDAFGPEEVKSYEVGAKAYVGDDISLNAALYKMDRENSQIDFTPRDSQPDHQLQP